MIAAAEEREDPTWSRDLIEAAERQQSILDAIARPAEKTKPWYEYRKIFDGASDPRGGRVLGCQRVRSGDIVERTGVPRRLSLPLLVSRRTTGVSAQLSGD